MRLALDSPAVTPPLASLGEEVFGLGTLKKVQVGVPSLLCHHPLTLYRTEVRKSLPAEAMVRPTFSKFLNAGLHAESGIQCPGEGRALLHIQVGSAGIWVLPPRILLGQCLKFECDP